MTVSPTWAPLARDVDSLVLAMKALWDGSMTEFDPLSPPVKFQTDVIICFTAMYLFTHIHFYSITHILNALIFISLSV